MRQYIDREAEMETLQKEYDRRGSSLVVLYGRRGIGKTTLVSEFIKDKRALFFLAGEESEAQNRNEFKAKTADFVKNDLLKNMEVREWEVIFKAIADTAFDSKPVIVMDEFQHIEKSNSDFLSVFQFIWNEILKNKEIMFILCSSRISAAEARNPAYDSPVRSCCTAWLRLKQIPFGYYHMFFPNKSRRELIELYSVTGGTPKYIQPFTESGDIYDSIQSRILDRSGYLYHEPYFLLQQEVMEIGSYFSIIKAIAAGSSRMSAISAELEMKATGLTKYLKILTDLDILEREIPVTEKNPETCKRGVYKIKDNYLRFWFAFIFPDMSYIERGENNIVMDKIHKSLINKHTALVYEDICRERMWNLNYDGHWPFRFSRIGRWWDKQSEIAIAAIDPEGSNLILGECKYWTEPVGIHVLYRLEVKACSVDWRKGSRHVWYVLFSASGFTEELISLAEAREDVLLVDEPTG